MKIYLNFSSDQIFSISQTAEITSKKIDKQNYMNFSQSVRRDYNFLLGLKSRRDYIFLKKCKKYQALYKQHHYSPSTILTSESLVIETVSNTSQIPACLYGPENLRRSHSNPKVGALKQPKLLYLFKCIFNSF